jgi:hypothetical protein
MIRRWGPLPEQYERRHVPVALLPILLLRYAADRDRGSWHRRLFPPLEDADDQAVSMLRRIDVPPGTRVAYVAPLRLLAGRSRLVGCWGHTATPGLRLAASGLKYVTTAGHFEAPVGTAVRLARPRRRFRRRSDVVVGDVYARTSPLAPDPAASVTGLDVALVQLLDGAASELTGRPLRRSTQPLEQGDILNWVGSVTGFRDGWVDGVWAERGERDGPKHRDCLLCFGRPRRGAGRKGDSGAAVFDAAGAFVGHLVGVDGFAEGGLRQAVTVQRGDLVLQYAVDHLGPLTSEETIQLPG